MRAPLVIVSVILLAWAATWVDPIFRLPGITGPYRIGTSGLVLPGKLKVQAWYPAEDGANGPFAEFDSRIGATRAMRDVAVRKKERGWPVLLYSVSWDGNRFENAYLCEDLASEGYVVFAVERPETPAPPALDFSTEESHAAFMAGADRMLKLQTSDVLALFGQLSGLESGMTESGLFKDRLDIGKTGIFGFSFGGAVAAEACRREPRLRGGADLDGTLFGEAARAGATQPFMFVTDFEAMPSEAMLQSPDGASRRRAEFSATGLNDMDRWLKTHGGWLVQFDRVRHENFSDALPAARESRWKRGRERDPAGTLKQIATLLAAFFGKTLNGQETTLPDENSTPWTGVRIQRFYPAMIRE